MAMTATTGRTLLSFPLFLTIVHAFSFSHNTPTECDPFTLTWSGGQPPFSVLIVPAFDVPRNFSVPLASNGSYSLVLPVSADRQFVVAMSDATGFATGGVSELLAVGKSLPNEQNGHHKEHPDKSDCDTKTPTPSFQFQLNSHLQQCAAYTINGFDGAVQPVTITGLIPLGRPVQLQSQPGQTTFTWDAVNVAAGTTMIFFLTDAAGRFGGSSRINQVENSPINTCLNPQSPSSTATAGFTTLTGSSTSSLPPTPTRSRTTPVPNASATTNPTPTSNKSSSPGTIAGAVVGCFVAFLVVGSLLSFWYRKYYERRSARRFSTYRRSKAEITPRDYRDGPNTNNSARATPTPAQWTTFAPTRGDEYAIEPWVQSENTPYQPNPGMSYQSNTGNMGYQPNAGYQSDATYQSNAWNTPPQQLTPGYHRPNPANMAYQRDLGHTHQWSDSPSGFTGSTSQAGGSISPQDTGNVSHSYTTGADLQRRESLTELPYRSSSPDEKSPRPPQKSTRLVLHTAPDEDDDVDVPPIYSDRRANQSPSS